MLQDMRTTLDINDNIAKRAKARAALENKTLTEIIEESLKTYGLGLNNAVTASEVDPTKISGGAHDISEIFEKGSKLPVTEHSRGEFIDLGDKQG